MGLCVCKERQSESDEETFTRPMPRSSVNSLLTATDLANAHQQLEHCDPVQQTWDLIGSMSSAVDKLVLETLAVIRTLVDKLVQFLFLYSARRDSTSGLPSDLHVANLFLIHQFDVNNNSISECIHNDKSLLRLQTITMNSH